MKKDCIYNRKWLLALCLVMCAVMGHAQNMHYVTSDVAVVGNAAHEENSFPVLRLKIQTAGTSNPLSLISVLCKRDKKRQAVKPTLIYFTGHDSVFSASRLYGAFTEKSDSLIGQGAQVLAEGANYFWICADDRATATDKSKVFAPELISFDLGLQEYRQVWSDEFNADTINSHNWTFEKGFVRNRELQWYQEDNAACANGILTIEARRERKPNPDYVAASRDWRKSRAFIDYTSASMRTAGKQSWLYGRFEMRARIDTAPGYWPAWWTLGETKRWPANGEIDIMEYYRGKLLANFAVGTAKPSSAHWYSTTRPVASFADPQWKERFHVWRMDWDEEGISIYVDDILLNYQPQTNLYNRNGSGFFPFRQKHYMLLNLAIGGDNGGNPAQASFPLRYEVDYVRVSQKVAGKYIHAGTHKPENITVTAVRGLNKKG